MTRRPVRGLAPIEAAPVSERPPGPAEILAPDGRTFYRDPGDQLYYDATKTEVFSQAALRDLIERAAERLLRRLATDPDPVFVAIANARHVSQLRDVWPRATTPEHRAAIHGRRAVLELPPRGT